MQSNAVLLTLLVSLRTPLQNKIKQLPILGSHKPGLASPFLSSTLFIVHHWGRLAMTPLGQRLSLPPAEPIIPPPTQQQRMRASAEMASPLLLQETSQTAPPSQHPFLAPASVLLSCFRLLLFTCRKKIVAETHTMVCTQQRKEKVVSCTQRAHQLKARHQQTATGKDALSGLIGTVALCQLKMRQSPLFKVPLNLN